VTWQMLNDLGAADEIDREVDRLLSRADAYERFPTPVDDIVSAAALTQADDYVLDDSLIAKAPTYLRGLLRSAKRKIQGLVDRRERVVHVSPAIEHEGKRRFVILHETTHDILPHQRDLLYADDNETLSPATRRLFEREANQGAAELLLQRTRFTRDAADLEISVAAVWHLAERYGSSFHAAFRRYAETHSNAAAAIVLERSAFRSDPPTWRREEAMTNAAWTARFGSQRWPREMAVSTYPFLAALDVSRLESVILTDASGTPVEVRVDTCRTPYKSFVLLWIPERKLMRPRRVRLAASA
jgi:Zn-dependent peptidase ImmA (M78 family)